MPKAVGADAPTAPSTITVRLVAGCGRAGAVGDQGAVIDVETSLAQELITNGSAVAFEAATAVEEKQGE